MLAGDGTGPYWYNYPKGSQGFGSGRRGMRNRSCGYRFGPQFGFGNPNRSGNGWYCWRRTGFVPQTQNLQQNVEDLELQKPFIESESERLKNEQEKIEKSIEIQKASSK